MKYNTTEEYSQQLDNDDKLASFRDKFYIPTQKSGKDVIYFVGNSLGLQPKSASSYISVELKDWQNLGIEGHFKGINPWLNYHEYLTKSMAKIVGAKSIEVIIMNTLTVNLHLMFVSFYQPTPEKYKILVEKNIFPSDHYAIKSQIMFRGYNPKKSLITIEPRKGKTTIQTTDIIDILEKEGDSIALIWLGGVNYYTGQAFDMKKITEIGHAKNCIVGFDLAHAVGNIILKLHEWDVDFAVWCTYKYLNGGPGSIGGCFINVKHGLNKKIHRFAGWWGHNKETRFLMPPEFDPIEGVEGWQLSNPPIIALATLKASLDIFDKIGMEKLRKKSIILTGYLEYLIEVWLQDKVKIITPKEFDRRGCQLSIVVKYEAKEIFNKISKKGLICDWREPDVIRCAPSPLYCRFSDVYHFVRILKMTIQEHN